MKTGKFRRYTSTFHDAMANALENGFITIITRIPLLGTLKDLNAVTSATTAIPDDMIKAAREEGTPFRNRGNQFTVSGKLYPVLV